MRIIIREDVIIYPTLPYSPVQIKFIPIVYYDYFEWRSSLVKNKSLVNESIIGLNVKIVDLDQGIAVVAPTLSPCVSTTPVLLVLLLVSHPPNDLPDNK